jgi:ketosteroid isomerase-like protein
MSADTVRIVERLQGVLADLDVVAALEDEEVDRRVREVLGELAEPDFEIAMVGPDYLPRPVERTGADGFRDSWLDWTSPFEHYRIHVERVIDAGDQVVTIVRQGGTTKTGGVEIEATAGAVWTVRAGKVSRVEFHLDPAAAMRAAGLEG